MKNLDHALILREDDPLLPAILGVYEKQGIKDGAPNNVMKGPATFDYQSSKDTTREITPVRNIMYFCIKAVMQLFQ